MITTTTHSPIFGALIGQILGADRPPSPRVGEKRRARLESALVALLTNGNLQISRLADLIGVSDSTTRDDGATLVDEGLVTTWIVRRGTTTQRWYGLTPRGVDRAKELKEMEDDPR
ncbi:MAG: hypothetical protein RBT67_02895 [Thauera sp.]|nr:hypothetical protein [Thauera sp.]